MASKLRNKNQRTANRTNGLDKQDPLDLETLNSEPKGKSKSNKSRLREQQEREKLLQQHRLQQQEALKRQRGGENVQEISPTAEHHEPNQDTQSEQPAKAPPTTETIQDVLQEKQQLGSEPDAHPALVESGLHDHESLNDNDEGHGAVGDSISPKVKPNHQRCTNCCGRDQYPLKSTCNGRCRSGEKCQIHEADAAQLEKPSQAQTSFLKQQPNYQDENETRLRGGCGGGCGGGGGTRNSACCPCGGCGGPACGTSTSCDSTPPIGCCGGNQSRGLPCRCKCRSCSSPSPPCGTCGGQNCGKWNSCAGSGGGKCCFPRNTKRQNGPGCCGGGNGGCGSCGGCC